MQPAQVDGGDSGGVELGLKFRSDVAGAVTGVRFYKAAANTGTHIGSLWSSSGTKLATVTFANESASGWQQALFSSPVNIQANTTYVVSYYAPNGHYSINEYFFNSAADNAPLHAPAGSTGVYKYGKSSAFPNQSWHSSNYWVDVMFRTSTQTAAPAAPAGSVSFWNSKATPALIDDGDTNAIEVGLKFTSDVAGNVTGVRFYKGANNMGTHTGNLWSSSGQNLATVTFSNETASGWQQALFSKPVAIQAKTTYVISYYAPRGHYSTNEQFFGQALDVAPLHAAASAGVYSYGTSSRFPSQIWNASNYWVDVIFQPTTATTPVNSPTSTVVSSSPNPSTAGQAVTLTAVISASNATPTGTVQFRDGSTVLGTAAVSGGRAAMSSSALGVGAHTITAVYSGDGTCSTSTSAALVQTVKVNPQTTTALASSANPSTSGQAVTFTAVVTAASGTPTGSVQFRDGGSVLGTVALSGGRASFGTTTLSAGSHTITAVYSGDSTYTGSTSNALAQTVNSTSARATTTALSASATSVAAGGAVTLTATVSSSSGTPTGSVQFRDGSTVLATATLSSGRASLATSTLSAGSHSLTAYYTGNSTYAASTSAAVSVTVNSNPATTTTVSSSANPSTSGQAVTFTANVTATSGTATGSVQFRDGSTVLGTGTLSGGRATLSVSSLAVGSHSITAVYAGDSTHNASTSAALTQTVQNAVAHSATVSWSASQSTNVSGYNVYRATVSGGPYTKLNSSVIPLTTYTDSTVQAGQTYYYVCTSVDSSKKESGYSNQATAVIPKP
ncbi:MAG: DUF4082 domain-containing protein [Acidobacteriota bacterium]